MVYKRKTTKDKSMGKIKHKKTTIDGITFDSKMESEYYLYLKELKAANKILDFELQPPFVLQEKFIIVNGQVINGNDPDFNKIKRQTKAPTVQAIKYIGDFAITHLDNSIEIVDTKGIETTDFKIKKKMFMMKYPHLKFSVITKTKALGWVDYDTYKKDKAKRKKEKGK